MSTVMEIKDAIQHLAEKEKAEIAVCLQTITDDDHDILLPARIRQEALNLLDDS